MDKYTQSIDRISRMREIGAFTPRDVENAIDRVVGNNSNPWTRPVLCDGGCGREGGRVSIFRSHPMESFECWECCKRKSDERASRKYYRFGTELAFVKSLDSERVEFCVYDVTAEYWLDCDIDRRITEVEQTISTYQQSLVMLTAERDRIRKMLAELAETKQ